MTGRAKSGRAMTDKPLERVMNPNSKINLWLKDGSVLKDWLLVSADLRIAGLPLDVGTVERVDDAFLYLAGGSKVYRERVGGSLTLAAVGMTDPLKLSMDQVAVMSSDSLGPAQA